MMDIGLIIKKQCKSSIYLNTFDILCAELVMNSDSTCSYELNC